MPTPPLPSRDDDPPAGNGEGEAVTLWAYRKRNGDFMYDSDKIDERDVEMRALPVAAYNTLLARANTAKVAADLMRARAERAEALLTEVGCDGTGVLAAPGECPRCDRIRAVLGRKGA